MFITLVMEVEHVHIDLYSNLIADVSFFPNLHLM